MKVVKLSNIIDIISGGTPATNNNEYWNGNIGWLSVADFNNDDRFVYHSEKTITEKGLKESSTKILNIGDTIISARGTVGALSQIGKPMAFNQSCFGLRAKKDIINEDFLYYILKNYVRNLQVKSQGSVFGSINLSTFDMMELSIPNLKTQQSIAKILSQLDQKIALNNQINVQLEQMAKTIYDYWFVQFDFPDENGKPYQSSGGEMIYNEVLKREIPKGWGVKKLGDIEQNIITGKTPSTQNENNFGNDIPFITIGDIRNNAFIVNVEQKLSILGANSQSKKYIPKDSLCVSCIATIGLIGFSTERSQTNQQINSIVFNNDYNMYFLYFALNDFFVKGKAKTGNTFANMNKADFESIIVLYPKLDLLKEYHLKIKYFFEKIKNNSIQNQQLTQLRDFLLPMLMNGQVGIGDGQGNA
ncbi:restriction endonuclease subunit S [Moraxella haemolytica]|uniref:restriction endonuclease subunit S n=1 Tax=Moraxella haemolytica TaxID=2904119 RepID=UPI0025431E1A|nr:restriction endonuclease subunit S [Moraxella sp. ZY171148]WII95495.1 restriction endonuclease subunit S [Moraxella sp. ZY171148]